ncbi:MAG: hypothetical protein HeimC3_18750 [Candidatus Heimdallarchaeota archaeon LC_3]|nr:MAG: hypothetical protein HeimC3_18750 [Candidatus Heimdallarchaeota archaeon LC_3]
MGSSSLDPEAQRFIFKSINLMLITGFFEIGIYTFFVLYSLEFLSIEQLGLLIGIQFLFQSILDYPTGALGDWIGQKWILVTSYLFFGLGYLIFSYAEEFFVFLVAFILIAIGNSQHSGAYMTWLDNNYKIYVPEDKNRQTYSFIFSRFQVLFQLNLFISILSLGFLVDIFGRQWGFFVLGASHFISIILVFFLVTDHKDYVRPPKEKKEFLNLLKEGIGIGWNNKTLRYMILGMIIVQGALMIWANLILFPMYESYAITDVGVSFTRAIIWLYGAVALFFLGYLVKRIYNTQKWLGILSMISMPLFFFMFFIYLQIMPAGDKFSIVSWLLLIVVFSMVNTLGSIVQILIPKFFLDLIPDKNRNSIYSLIPSLIMVFNILTVTIGGYLIKNLGIIYTILILSLMALVAGLISGTTILKHKVDSSESKEELVKNLA